MRQRGGKEETGPIYRNGPEDRGLERLLELDRADADKVAANVAAKQGQDRVGGRPEQRRGELRKQAAEQLEKLQQLDQRETAKPKEAASQQPSQTQQGQTPSDTAAAAVGTGQLSLDLDVGLVGAAHHFRKLHGEPTLVLRARHEDLSRGLTAIVWAALCLALAAAVIHGLRRPDAIARAYRLWPWLGAIAGMAWLFLLPAGVCGLALLVTALCVLVARTRRPQITNSETSNVEQRTS